MFNEKGQEIVNIDEVLSLKHVDTDRVYNRISNNRFQYFERTTDTNEDNSYNQLDTTSIVVSASLMKEEVLKNPTNWNILSITDDAKNRLKNEADTITNEYLDCLEQWEDENMECGCDYCEEKQACIEAQADSLKWAVKYRLLSNRINNLLTIYKSRRDLAYLEDNKDAETIDMMIDLLESLSK